MLLERVLDPVEGRQDYLSVRDEEMFRFGNVCVRVCPCVSVLK